jgi:hypothetical protein
MDTKISVGNSHHALNIILLPILLSSSLKETFIANTLIRLNVLVHTGTIHFRGHSNCACDFGSGGDVYLFVNFISYHSKNFSS